MNNKEIPSPDEIQKELAKFLKEKFAELEKKLAEKESE